jgi:hypothetical protein
MKRAWLAAGVLGVVGCALTTSGTVSAQEIPVPAWAPAAGAEDVVVLKDGGAVRGTVMEVLPNDHVSVKLADGRTAIIAWSVVHHIEQAAKPAAPATPATPTPPQVTPKAPEPATPAISGSVHVQMEGDGDAVLEQDHGGAWAVVCSGACNRDLPLDVAYRIMGSGVKNSGAFRLQGKPGDHIVLHLSTASPAAFSGGVTMALVGGLAATIGFWGTLFASSNDDSDYDYQNGEDIHHQSTVVPWLVTTLVGAAVGTIGLVMAVSNEKTKITQTANASEKAQMLFGTKTATTAPDRTPTWASLRPAGIPAADTGTIFSFKF